MLNMLLSNVKMTNVSFDKRTLIPNATNYFIV